MTFGARDTDVTLANDRGWSAWFDEQLAAPQGDDPAVAAHLAQQIMHIKYNAPADTDMRGTW